MCMFKRESVCVQDCAVRSSQRRYAHGMSVYEIQTMLKRKRDWVYPQSPKALHGNAETDTYSDRKHLLNP